MPIVAAEGSGSMALPKVSVLITCHNLGWALGEALASVWAQTFQDFEVLLVDDGSTDPETRATIDALDPSRVKVFRTERRGACAARNMLVREARGEYVTNFDADDVMLPDFLQSAVEILDAEPTIAFVSSWIEFFGSTEMVWKEDRCDLAALLEECTINGPSPVRREAFLAVGGYDEAMAQCGEDQDLWIRLVRRGYAGTIIPRVLYRYRRHPASVTSLTSVEDRVRAARQIAERHAGVLRGNLEEVVLARQLRNAETRFRILSAVASSEPRVLSPATAVDRSGVAACMAELEKARSEVEALRRSMSWKITRPLRVALDWVRSARGRE